MSKRITDICHAVLPSFSPSTDYRVRCRTYVKGPIIGFLGLPSKIKLPLTISQALTPNNRTHDSSAAMASVISQDHEEYQYLNLIKRILSEGEYRPDR
jgi:hypothetical protein